MPRPMKVRDIIKLIEADGWYLVRIRGSHRQFHHSIKTGTVTVPGKPSDVLQPKMVKSILNQAELGEE
jgi:predicted RNA binding protein YcfA (HicA-like mRNA interferase family)